MKAGLKSRKQRSRVGILPTALVVELCETRASIFVRRRFIIEMVGRMPTLRDGADTVLRGAHR